MRGNRKLIASVLTLVMIMTSLLSQVTISLGAKSPEPDRRNKMERKVEKTQILVKYKDPSKGGTVQSQTMSSLGISKLEKKGRFRHSQIEVLEINEGEDITKVVNKLRQNPEVEFAQPNYKLSSLESLTLPQDARFMEQWNINSKAETTIPVDINAPEGWLTTKGSPAVLVGVLDTGIDINHEDLAPNVYVNLNEIPGNGIDDDGNGFIDDTNGWDFFNEDNTVFDNASQDTHGTHVAGIIAASQNTTGISGVAPEIKILPLKFINNGQGYTSDVIAAIEYCKQMGVKIINCSFGGSDNNPALREAMESSDILFVCAAGNDGKDLTTNPVYPASFNLPNMITVAATDNSGKIASFSNFGSLVDIAAPGKDILSTVPGNRYGVLSGTSMAAPHVTAAAALIKSHLSDSQVPDLLARLKQGVRTSTPLKNKVVSGGLLDVKASLVTTVIDQPDENKPGTGGQTGSQTDGLLTTLAATVSPQLMEQIHYGEVGVNVATGNFSDSTTDMTLDAPGFKVNISRTYNSKDDRPTSTMGRGWTFGFEGSLKQDTTNTSLWVAKLPNGSAQVFVKSGETYQANDSRSTLVKQADATHILTTKDQYTYGFNTNGYLVWMKDKNGNAVNIEVDAQGKVLKITNQVGRQFTVQYDAGNKIQKITDPMDRVIEYVYTNNNLTSVKDPMGKITTYSYDASNYLTEIKDKNNVSTTTLVYDHASGTHKVTTFKDVYGVTQSFAYDTANKKTTITYNGRTLVKWYDDQYFVVKSQDPEGKTATISYYLDASNVNKYGEEKTITDRNGNVTEYVRDTATGNITKIINPDKSERLFEYDTKSNLIKETDETGKLVQYIYDDKMINLLKEVRPLNGTTVYTSASDPSQFAITTYIYYTADELSDMGVNAKSLLKSVTNPEGNITRYLYDQYGNVKSTIDPLGYATETEYNLLGWITSTKTAMGYVTQYSYDFNGNVIKQVKNGGETTRILYDSMGRKIQEIAPNQYDWTKDNLQANTYADANAGTRYKYFSHGGIETITDALGNITAFTYDVYGNVETKKLPNQSQYVYEYDFMNRVTKEYFKADSETTTPKTLLAEYAYTILADKTTQTTKTQYLNQTDKAITVTVFDAQNRQIKLQNPDQTTETRAYYTSGLLKSVTDANSATVVYGYDGLNRLSEKWVPSLKAGVDNGVYHPALYRFTEYVYDKAGRVKAEKSGKDLVELYQKPVEDRKAVKSSDYFANGKIKTVTDGAGGRVEYNYDKDGYISKEKTFTSDSEFIQKDYQYNDGKLMQEKLYIKTGDLYPNKMDVSALTALTTSYQYDKNGNLIQKTTPDMQSVNYEYDLLNRLTKTKQIGNDEAGRNVTLQTLKTYDNMGNVKTLTDVDGQITSYDYDKRGNLLKTSLTYKENGETQTEVRSAVAYDLAQRVIIEVNAEDYDPAEQLTEMNRVEYTYDVMGRRYLTKHVYKEAGSTEWKTQVSEAVLYDKIGNAIKTLDGEGYEAGAGSSTQAIIASGYGVIRTFDLQGKLLTELDPVSKDRGYAYSMKYAYNGLGQKVSETSIEGSILNYYYDDASRLVETTVQETNDQPEKTVNKNSYDKAGFKVTQTDGTGNTTTFKYNQLGQLRETVLPGDDSIAVGHINYQYDTMGRLMLQRDSEGTETLNSYDRLGRLIAKTEQGESATSPVTIRYAYDIKGNVVSKTDGEGNKAQYAYNYLGKVLTESLPLGHVTNYTYDKLGNIETKTDWLNNTYTYTYDALYRLESTKGPDNNLIERLDYDLSNRQKVSYDGKGNDKEFIYDHNGRLVGTIDQEGWQTKQTYDADGNVKTKTDGNGNVITFEYDALNQLVKVTNALGEATSYSYDTNGNLLTQTDGNGNTITMVYNARNLLLKRISPNDAETGDTNALLSFTESYTYHSDGTLKDKQDRNGGKTSYVYDVHKRLINILAGNDKILNVYDDNSNLISTTSGDTITNRTYDALGRVVSKYESGIGTASYTYDITTGVDPGEVAEKSVDPKGNEATKTYDKLGRLKELKNGSTVVTTYAYDQNGNVDSVSYPSAVEKYAYLKNNKLAALENFKVDQGENVLMDSYTYAYDKAGNQTSKNELVNNVSKGITTYTYDKLNRLKEVKEPNGQKTLYQFDKAGNRTLELKQKDGLSDSTTYTYDKQNRLTQTLLKKTGETTTTKYHYDNNGNMTSKQQESVKNATKETKPHFGIVVIEDEQAEAQQNGTFTANAYYTYNMFNQMVRSTTDNSTQSYAYNGDGLRSLTIANGQTTRYFYEYDKVILEVDAQGKEMATNTYGLNLVSRKVIEGGQSKELFYLYNGHADVTALLNADSDIVGTYYYDAFGNILNKSGSENNPFRYSGYRYDEATGLYYLNARYYDSTIARFLSEDTYTGDPYDALSLNLYTYCANNPIIYVDPTGHTYYNDDYVNRALLNAGYQPDPYEPCDNYQTALGLGLISENQYNIYASASIDSYNAQAIDSYVDQALIDAGYEPDPHEPGDNYIAAVGNGLIPDVYGVNTHKDTDVIINRASTHLRYDIGIGHLVYPKAGSPEDILWTMRNEINRKWNNGEYECAYDVAVDLEKYVNKAEALYGIKIIDDSLFPLRKKLEIAVLDYVLDGEVSQEMMKYGSPDLELVMMSGFMLGFNTGNSRRFVSEEDFRRFNLGYEKKATYETIQENMVKNGAQWKSQEILDSHVAKRIKKGDLSIGSTAADYNKKINQVMNNKNVEVYEYSVSEKTGQPFDQKYYIYGDGDWIVMVGENGIMETAFRPSGANGGYSGYLKGLGAKRIK